MALPKVEIIETITFISIYFFYTNFSMAEKNPCE